MLHTENGQGGKLLPSLPRRSDPHSSNFRKGGGRDVNGTPLFMHIGGAVWRLWNLEVSDFDYCAGANVRSNVRCQRQKWWKILEKGMNTPFELFLLYL